MELVIVTGLSGAGKSRAVDALEDIGFFCADNMPPKLIPTFVRLILNSRERRDKVAIVTDIRVGASFSDLFSALKELNEIEYKILFMEASNEVLLRRYKETRRKHPLIDKYNGSIIDALQAERELLMPVKQFADYVIDSTHITATECKQRIVDIFSNSPKDTMRVLCVSFGYKYGMPTDSDLVFDVRCLPNPFYVNEIKLMTGLDEPVREYVMKWDQAKNLVPKLLDLIDYLVPLYQAEGKSQLVISIGCTGGRHRSVVFTEIMKEHLLKRGLSVNVNHRDIKK